MAKTIQDLENLRSTLEDKLSSSPTAYARNTSPSKGDLTISSNLSSLKKQIEGLRSEQRGNRWYGVSDKDDDVPGKPEGFFMRGLEGLQKPLNTIAGAAQYALDIGTKSSLLENTKEAREKGLTFGDILKQEGVDNRAVRGTLGLLLNVMFDPINWATVGTSALIPRIGVGLVKGATKSGVKGALEAAGKGLTSNLSKKAIGVSKFLPIKTTARAVGRVAENVGEYKGLEGASNLLTKGIEKGRTLAEKFAARAVKDADRYDELIGKDPLELLGKGLIRGKGFGTGKVGAYIDDAIRGKNEILNKIPGVRYLGKDSIKGLGQTKGDIFADFFDYSPLKRNTLMEKKDEIIKEMEKIDILGTGNIEKADFLDLADFYNPKAQVTRFDPKSKQEVREFIRDTITSADGTITNPLKKEFQGGKIRVLDNIENANALLEQAGKAIDQKLLVDMYKPLTPGLTGVDVYDNFIARVKNTSLRDWKEGRLLGPKVLASAQIDAKKLVDVWNSGGKEFVDIKPLNNLLKGLENFTFMFKAFKVPLNVGSHVVAYLGNFFMGAMMGLPTWKQKYIESVMIGRKFAKGKLSMQQFAEVFTGADDSMRTLAVENPTVFKSIFGVNPLEIFDRMVKEEKLSKFLNYRDEMKSIEERMTEMGKEVSVIRSIDETVKIVDDLPRTAGVINTEKAIEESLSKFKTPTEGRMEDMMNNIKRTKVDEYSSFLGSSEMSESSFYERWRNSIATKRKENPNDFTLKFTNMIVNGMTKSYESIDQGFKIGNFIYLTKVGLTAEELAKVGNIVDLTDSVLPVVISGGEKLYKIKPLAATRISSEAYMNYSAMPDFVKVMRSLPMVSAPFLSFQYAMLPKTAKTLLHNPSYFNKVSFALNEMNSGRSPEERIALENKYNQYLNSPTVVKFFGMMNVDVKGYIPHLTMNMLNPSERTYDDSPQGKALKALDKLPVMQHPIGQMFKDYFLQPMVLKGTGQNPQGQFGQPLYQSYDEKGRKIDVGLMGRAPYALRTLADAITPGVANYLGVPLGMTGMSPEAIDYLPSYGMRSLANATQGRTSIGKMTKENVIQKTLRTLFSRTGFPMYPLDITKTNINK